MSHPNPYLFQISRMIMHVRSRVDITSRVRSYRCRTIWISRTYFYVWMSCIVLWFIRTWLDVNIIHSENFMLYIFNVSSTKNNVRARLSRYVWYGCYSYPKNKYFFERVGIFLYLATPNNIYLATPSFILSELIFFYLYLTSGWTSNYLIVSYRNRKINTQKR